MSQNNGPDTTAGQQSTTGQTGNQQSTTQTGGQQQTPDREAGENRPNRGTSSDGLTDWLASSALRASIVIIGFLLFLFAIGQAVGLELLDMFIGAVTSQTGRWLIVAAFALVLIFIGQQGVKRSSYYD